MILVAGPYRSGTNDDPKLIKANVDHMQAVALQLYRRGHLPVLGEWFALPLIEIAGSKRIGDDIFNEIFHPISVQLINKCDAVLRIGGPSAGADEMVAQAEKKGKLVFRDQQEIPAVLSTN
ncbi:hypothetical protein [uncultured Chitinophaga sp.]|uniref:hypothetical protein n=1 Tax=uncultured Chitinophaga sp. TaxID=339340 RepID=UPI0025D91E76|nr:hypothetical protein [uncultured Chitinophaga sp.]